MKASIVSLLALTLVFVFVVSANAADGEQRLTGSYVWTAINETSDIEAVFTPTGDSTWNVAFYFVFDGRDRVFSGTAEGDLSDGSLKGSVQDENKRRTWTFAGKSEGGVFSGDHAEIRKGKETATGTITFGPSTEKKAA